MINYNWFSLFCAIVLTSSAIYTAESQNLPPVAKVIADQIAKKGESITLDGTQSSDHDENYPLSYLWIFAGKPENSQASLSNPYIENPTVTLDKYGDYEFLLIVTDSLGGSSPVSHAQVSVINEPPIANAGINQSNVIISQTAYLDGSMSWDQDQDSLTYQWEISSKPGGSSATLVDPNSISPTFIPDVVGDYVINLVVSDGILQSNPATITVSAITN